MFKNENGVNVGLASELFNECNGLMNLYNGTTSRTKGEKKLVYASELFAHELTESNTYWVKVYAVYSERKNRDDRYNFKDMLFEITDGDDVLFSSASITECFAYAGELLTKIENDAEWEKLLAENEFIGNEMFALENTIDENVEKAKAAMDDAKQLIGGMNDVDWRGRDDDELKKSITNYCGDIAEALIGIAQASQNFLKNCSDFTGCDFTLGDAYSDCPVIAFNNYYDELDQFDCTLAFEQILDDIFENGSDEMLDLRDTLYHYLMVA